MKGGVLLFYLQRYKIESKSQLSNAPRVIITGCCSICKDIKLKANHNHNTSVCDFGVVVVLSAKI